MAEAEIPYTFTVRKRTKKAGWVTYWYFRRNGTVARLPSVPGTAEFQAAYDQKMRTEGRIMSRAGAPHGSWSDIIAKYRVSAEFTALASPTQDDYNKTLNLLVIELGPDTFSLTTRAMIKAVRDDYKDTHRKANKIKQMSSRLYSWADENDLVPEGLNPTRGLKKLKPQDGKGEREITVWSDHEIALYLGNARPHLIAPVMIALYTGQRLSDVVSMTWKQLQGDMVRVRTSKTRALLDIACHPELRAFLDALPRGDAVQICLNQNGKPWKANTFSTALNREVASIAGMPDGRSLHGLRYAAGSKLDEGGATVAEIESVLGHRTFRMALKYASQRLRAKAAIAKMDGSR